MDARPQSKDSRAIRLALKQFNERAWKDHISTRFASIAVSSLFVLFLVGVGWGLFIAACSITGFLWDTLATRTLHRTTEGPAFVDDADAAAKRRAFIAVVAIGSAIYCLPYAALSFAPSPGPILGMIFSTGAISLIIGQHVLSRTMSLWTLPTPTLALAANAVALAPGTPGIIAAVLAVIVAGNAFVLATASWRSSKALIDAQIDAEDNAGALEKRVQARTEELQKETARAEASRSLLEQLTGGIAHDFNNALTAIASSAEAMRSLPDSDPRRHQILDAIGLASAQAGGMTRKLLAYSRQQMLEPRVVDLNQAVEDALHLIRPLVGADILIQTSFDPKRPHALLDPAQFASALMNLALNARDAMPAGGVLKVSTCVLDDFEHIGPCGTVEIDDNGVGMDAETQARMFDPYFTTKLAGRGNGLGLSMVQGFVIQSGGSISVQSTPGKGSRFRVGFPLCRPSASRPSALETAPSGPRGDLPSILLVEDNDLVRDALVLSLEGAGYSVRAASSGGSALALMDAGIVFDVLVTDVVMPGGMNGLQLAEQVLKRAPATKVLAMSGYAPSKATGAAELPEGLEFLQKPITLTALEQKMASVTQRGMA